MSDIKHLTGLLESAKAKRSDIQYKQKLIKKELELANDEFIDISITIGKLEEKLSLAKSREVVDEVTQREVDIARAYGYTLVVGELITDDIRSILRGGVSIVEPIKI